MPKRNYAKEYRDFHGKPEQIERRASRNKARAALERDGRVRRGDGKDVDHKNMNPMDNRKSNLRVQPKSANRSRNRK
jgi:hypothetical protein